MGGAISAARPWPEIAYSWNIWAAIPPRDRAGRRLLTLPETAFPPAAGARGKKRFAATMPTETYSRVPISPTHQADGLQPHALGHAGHWRTISITTFISVPGLFRLRAIIYLN
jgi:hypothetical protein